MIEAAIFDMDGLISDTEPLWGEVMVRCFKLSGINLTREECWQTQGVGTREAIAYWYHRYPNDNMIPQKEMFNMIISEMVEEINQRLVIMPGVIDTLDMMVSKNIPIALASGSPMAIIDAVLDKACIRHYFKIIQTASTLKYGKPNPEIFITVAEALGVPHFACLVFEDSVNGVIAAKAAKMKIVAVPDPNYFDNPYYVLADYKLHSLTEFTPEHLNGLKC